MRRNIYRGADHVFLCMCVHVNYLIVQNINFYVLHFNIHFICI